MKAARLITLLGSIVLAGAAAFHSSGYTRAVLPLIQKNGMTWPASGVFKALWLAFSVLLLALAVIALLARDLEGGGAIVLVTAAANAVCVVMTWHFLGLFIGVYLLSAVTILLGIGGAMQAGAKKAS